MKNTQNTSPNNARRAHTWKIILFIVLLIIIAYVLWFGFGGNNTALAPEVNTQWATYDCPSGNTVAANFSNSGDTVQAVLADGTIIGLTRTRSADGGRYANADESFILWEKGSTALITHGEITETCVNEEDKVQNDKNKQAITQRVTDFGKTLQDVSLLAPDASSTMAEKYASYVTPELLHEWQQDPSNAPGRKTSSPWPDHINITKITPGGVVYSVLANVVLATSKEVASGGNVGMIPVEMTMSNRDGKWLIASYMVKATSTNASSTGS